MEDDGIVALYFARNEQALNFYFSISIWIHHFTIVFYI